MSSFVKNPLQVVEQVEQIFGDDLHARRVLSLANGVVGTIDAAVLSIHAIGRGYARVTNNDKKHGVKQTDRMLGNQGINVWTLFRPWTQFVVGERKEIVLALDWTEFDADDHATLAGYLITSHGRATPLIWMTVSKTTLKNKRNDHEYRLIERLHLMRPPPRAISHSDDRVSAPPLHFDARARTVREQLEVEHLGLVAALETVSPKLAAHYGKFDGIFARLCLLWHCIDNADAPVIPAEVPATTAESCTGTRFVIWASTSALTLCTISAVF